MKVSKYEKTYVSVYDAEMATTHVDEVAEYLQKQSEPVTCATIGKAIFGDKYDHYLWGKSCSAKMGQILRHLRKGGFVKVEERKGAPIEIEVDDYIIPNDENGEPPMITVYDAQGREYKINNPNYNPMGGWKRGHWEKVKKTINPTIKVWSWVAE